MTCPLGLAESYIRANYPGDVEALIARCGNDQYDGADSWQESGTTETPGLGTKLQQRPGADQWLDAGTTPRPDEWGVYPIRV